MDSAGTEIGSMHSFVKPHFYPRHAKDAFDFCMITEKEMKNAIEFPEIVGCIAGDDTIMIAIKTNDEAVMVMKKLREMMA